MVSLRHEGGKMSRSQLSVLLQPGNEPVEADACVVVDVLRATSSLVTMFERGLEEAIIASSLDEARVFAERDPGLLLCGEEGGLPPDGFDHGNSPSTFDEMDLSDKRAVLVTTNGTRALQGVPTGTTVLVGALLNVEAIARTMVAQDLNRASIVCAGERGGASVCVEDVYCAGAIVGRMLTLGKFDVDDGAAVALQVYRSFLSPVEALLAGKHGPALRELGFAEDIVFCAREDVFSSVPVGERDTESVLRVRVRSGC
jgi:2-phosphosulfolactate phosphatase